MPPLPDPHRLPERAAVVLAVAPEELGALHEVGLYEAGVHLTDVHAKGLHLGADRIGETLQRVLAGREGRHVLERHLWVGMRGTA